MTMYSKIYLIKVEEMKLKVKGPKWQQSSLREVDLWITLLFFVLEESLSDTYIILSIFKLKI